MATGTDHHILDQMLEPVVRCLTPAVAPRIASLRADPLLQQRLDQLAEKNAEGKLSSRDEAEYEAYIEALDVVAVLQAKARKCLAHRRAGEVTYANRKAGRNSLEFQGNRF